jgi:hypothetical protein
MAPRAFGRTSMTAGGRSTSPGVAPLVSGERLRSAAVRIRNLRDDLKLSEDVLEFAGPHRRFSGLPVHLETVSDTTSEIEQRPFA